MLVIIRKTSKVGTFQMLHLQKPAAELVKFQKMEINITESQEQLLIRKGYAVCIHLSKKTKKQEKENNNQASNRMWIFSIQDHRSKLNEKFRQYILKQCRAKLWKLLEEHEWMANLECFKWGLEKK